MTDDQNDLLQQGAQLASLNGQMGQSSGPGLSADPDFVLWLEKKEEENRLRERPAIRKALGYLNINKD